MNKDDATGGSPDEANRSGMPGKHSTSSAELITTGNGLHERLDANRVAPEGDHAEAKIPGKRRGRPSKGASVPMRLSDEERLIADLMGDGIAAEGVRMALRVVARLGIDAARLLAVDAPAARPIKLSLRATAALEANPGFLAQKMPSAVHGISPAVAQGPKANERLSDEAAAIQRQTSEHADSLVAQLLAATDSNQLVHVPRGSESVPKDST